MELNQVHVDMAKVKKYDNFTDLQGVFRGSRHIDIQKQVSTILKNKVQKRKQLWEKQITFTITDKETIPLEIESAQYQSEHYNATSRNSQTGFEIPDEHSAPNTSNHMQNILCDRIFSKLRTTTPT